MQNDWYGILKLDKRNIYDENIALLIEYCFDDFIFKGYDENGNIILLYLKDNNEYIAVLKDNSLTLKLNTNFDSRFHKQYLNLSVCAHNALYPNVEEVLLKKYLKTSITTKDIEYSKNSSFYKITKNRVNYIYTFTDNGTLSSYDEFNCVNYSFMENVNIYSDVFYLDKNIKSKKVIPDVLCSTDVNNDNGEKNITKSLYIQAFKTSDQTTEIKTTLPIMYVACEEHKSFLENNCKDKESKIRLLNKSCKTGF